MSRHVVGFLAALLMLSAAAPAQINPGGVVNVASFAPRGLPSSGIARGSVFTIFGANLAAEGVAVAAEFPLQRELQGTSVEVLINGIVLPCWMIFTTPGQIAALLPSSTPTGSGIVRVRGPFGAFSAFIEVVDRRFGIFTRNQGGSGPAIFQNFDGSDELPVNGLDRPARPGQVGVLWGTGLGPVAGDESMPPVPLNVGGPGLEVFVGDVPVERILYAGRSSCCSGTDQINFEIPPGVEGCAVPVVAVVNGVPSNTATLSIAAEGSGCRAPGGFTANEVDQLLATGPSLNLGTISYGRTVSTSLTLGGSSIDNFAAAEFAPLTPLGLLTDPLLLFPASPGCAVGYLIRSIEGDFSLGLDAGPAVTVSGPGGVADLTSGGPGRYWADLSSAGEDFLTPGSYRFTAPGGADVGPMEVVDEWVDTGFSWANQETIVAVARDQPLTISWRGGGANERVSVFGHSTGKGASGAQATASFQCDAPASSGRLTVPAHVLSALPASGFDGPSMPLGSLGVGLSASENRFSAEGLELGRVKRSSAEQLTDVVFF